MAPGRATGAPLKIPANAVPEGYKLLAVYFLLCHPTGSANGQLAEDDDRRIIETSLKYFNDGSGVAFVAAFHSDVLATHYGVMLALQAVLHPTIGTHQRGVFDVGPLVLSKPHLGQLAALDKEIGATATAAEWLKRWDGAGRVRDLLRLGMGALPGQFSHETAGDATVPAFLVGYHGPYAGFAADNPENIGPISTGDVVVYFVSRGPNGVHHFHAIHWLCPIRD